MADVDKYETQVSGTNSQYVFISIGKRGRIEKRVQYKQMNVDGLPYAYNCALGDWIEVTRKINCDAISNNGDRNKVLATVVGTIYHYTNIFPNRFIHFRGTDEARTNLYGRIINEYHNFLVQNFYIFGVREQVINGNLQRRTEEFIGAERYKYVAFLIKRR
jgi:hypothetical protein